MLILFVWGVNVKRRRAKPMNDLIGVHLIVVDLSHTFPILGILIYESR